MSRIHIVPDIRERSLSMCHGGRRLFTKFRKMFRTPSIHLRNYLIPPNILKTNFIRMSESTVSLSWAGTKG